MSLNDLPDGLNSTVRLFADDALLYGKICVMKTQLIFKIHQGLKTSVPSGKLTFNGILMGFINGML